MGRRSIHGHSRKRKNKKAAATKMLASAFKGRREDVQKMDLEVEFGKSRRRARYYNKGHEQVSSMNESLKSGMWDELQEARGHITSGQGIIPQETV